MEKDGIREKRGKNENGFDFPLNIKQIGNMDKDLRVYIEDYVYTYLYRYAKTKAKSEKLAVLAGRYYRVDGQDTVVISGAVEGKYTIKENGNEIFTDETWEYVAEQMKKYFSDLSIIGWVRVQPEYGTFMMAKDEIFHKECFKNNWQVFFVIDPAEMQDAMYAFNGAKSSMRPVKGYFIYYDKNEPMQNYMIDHTIAEPKQEEESETITADSSGKTAVYRLLGMKGRIKKEEKSEEKYVPDRIDAAAKIRSVLNQKDEAKKESRGKEVVVGTVCMALSVACVAMCAGLIKERDKIRYLENEMAGIKSSYTAMSQRIENAAQQVFAIQENEKEIEVEEEKNEDEKKTKNSQYTIEEGDSLWYICRKFYGGENRIEEIKDVNKIENEDMLYVGQKIELP